MQVLGNQQLGRLPWLQTPTLKNSSTDTFYNLNECILKWGESEKKWRMDDSLQLAGMYSILFFYHKNGEICETMWSPSSSSGGIAPQGDPFDEKWSVRRKIFAPEMWRNEMATSVTEAKVETVLKNQFGLSLDRAGKRRQKPQTAEPTDCLVDELSATFVRTSKIFRVQFSWPLLCSMTWRQQRSGLLGICAYDDIFI